MTPAEQQAIWDAVRDRIEFASNCIHDSTQWYCEEWYDGKGSMLSALVRDVTKIVAEHYEQQLAAAEQRAEECAAERDRWCGERDSLEEELAAAEQRCQRLEAFITRNMQMHSPKMDSQHSWRFMNHCMRGKGQTASEALWRSIEIEYQYKIEDQYIREAARRREVEK